MTMFAGTVTHPHPKTCSTFKGKQGSPPSPTCYVMNTNQGLCTHTLLFCKKEKTFSCDFFQKQLPPRKLNKTSN